MAKDDHPKPRPKPKRKKSRAVRILPGQLWSNEACRLYGGIGRDELVEARKGGVRPVLVGHRLLYSTDELIAFFVKRQRDKDAAK